MHSLAICFAKVVLEGEARIAAQGLGRCPGASRGGEGSLPSESFQGNITFFCHRGEVCHDVR